MSSITRQLPRSLDSRYEVLGAARTKRDSLPPANSVLRAQTSTDLDDFFIHLQTARAQRLAAKQVYVANTQSKNVLVKKLRMFTSHFIQNLNHAIEREEITADARVFYNLDENDATVPAMLKEQEVITWAQNVVTGEANRIAAGGTALTQPSAAQIGTMLTATSAALAQQSLLYEAYNAIQEQLASHYTELDNFIKKLWAEIESAFADDPDAGSRRVKAEQWGIVYRTQGNPVAVNIEVLDATTNEPLQDAEIAFQQAGFEVSTAENGNAQIHTTYVGTDTVTIEHLDYTTQTQAITLKEGENINLVIKLVKIV